MIENVVVKNSSWTQRDLEILFSEEGKTVEEIHFTEVEDMQSLMAELGIFSSKSQAIKAGRKGEIPKGWTSEFKASKKYRLWIWNPSE